MRRKSVASSNLASIGYNNVSSTLEIEFQTGSIYQYTSVPDYVFEGLMNAHSHGQFFNQNIRYSYNYCQMM